MALHGEARGRRARGALRGPEGGPRGDRPAAAYSGGLSSQGWRTALGALGTALHTSLHCTWGLGRWLSWARVRAGAPTLPCPRRGLTRLLGLTVALTPLTADTARLHTQSPDIEITAPRVIQSRGAAARWRRRSASRCVAKSRGTQHKHARGKGGRRGEPARRAGTRTARHGPDATRAGPGLGVGCSPSPAEPATLPLRPAGTAGTARSVGVGVGTTTSRATLLAARRSCSARSRPGEGAGGHGDGGAPGGGVARGRRVAEGTRLGSPSASNASTLRGGSVGLLGITDRYKKAIKMKCAQRGERALGASTREPFKSDDQKSFPI